MSNQEPENRENREEQTWVEEIEVAGNELVARVRELIEEGNVRRLIIRRPDDTVLMEVPLTTGVAVGLGVTLLAPIFAALGALAAIVARVKIEVIRADDSDGDNEKPKHEGKIEIE